MPTPPRRSKVPVPYRPGGTGAASARRRLPDPGPRPKTMTWAKAIPVLAVCLVFDAVRFIFEWFILFGPAFLGAGAGYLASGYLAWLPGNAGPWLSGLVGAATAGASGYYGFSIFLALGEIMSVVIGIAGWITVLLILISLNRRVFRRDAKYFIWMLVGFVGTETPFLGSISWLTITVARLYYVQIKKEKGALRAWEAAQRQIAQAQQEELAYQIASRRRELLEERASYAAEEIPEEEGVAA